jgi:hypothetical protein
MDLQTGDVCVFANDDFKIIWNGSTTFNVYNQFDTEVDVFTVNGVDNSSDAIWHAREHIDNLYKEMAGHNV